MSKYQKICIFSQFFNGCIVICCIFASSKTIKMKKNQETPKTMWKAWLTYLALLAFLAFCVMVAQSCMTIDINFNQKQPITNPTDTTAIEAAWY